MHTSPFTDSAAVVHEYLVSVLPEGGRKKGIAIGEEGVKLDSKNVRLRLLLGDAYLRLHQPEEALSHYVKADEMEKLRRGAPVLPDFPGHVSFTRSSALFELKRWKEALEAVDEAIKREPNNALYLIDGASFCLTDCGMLRLLSRPYKGNCVGP